MPLGERGWKRGSSDAYGQSNKNSNGTPYPTTPTVSTTPTIDDSQSKAIQYMTCAGLSKANAAKLLNATGGDVNKAVLASHLVISGSLEDTPFTKREKDCLKSSGVRLH
jgi:hypothetical protein